jgi:hypothetical protein
MHCARPVRSWFAWGVIVATACAIEPRFVGERDAPDGSGSGSGAGASSSGGASTSRAGAAGSGLPTTDGCVTDCVRNVLTGPGLSCKFCHTVPPGPKYAGLDLSSPNPALRLRDRPALHGDVPPGSVCSSTDKLIDVEHPEESWLLKKVRGQQGRCGEPMPQGAPQLDAQAMACLQQYVDCVVRTPNGSGTTGTGGAPTGGGTGPSSGGTTGVGGSVVTPTGGVPLTPVNGWIDGSSNELGIQGAMFAYADETSAERMMDDFIRDHACISGIAAKVDLQCTPVPPAGDCYGTYWGAAIGLNLNQAINPETRMGEAPLPYDASGLDGFSFEVTGPGVPASLRFKVETAAAEFCSPPPRPVRLGSNSFRFDELLEHCWAPGGMSAEAAKSQIVKIAWQVVTNSAAEVPFDFCVGSLRALRP